MIKEEDIRTFIEKIGGLENLRLIQKSLFSELRKKLIRKILEDPKEMEVIKKIIENIKE